MTITEPLAETATRTTSGALFIAGPDRSGTTLMYALLASHPDVSMVRRTNMWRYFHRRYGDLGDAQNLDRCLADMVAYRRMRHLNPDETRIRQEFVAGPPTYGRLFSLFHVHHAERAGKRRWGDKSLHTEHYADRVFAEYPDACIVHMVRDPRDRYASVRRRHGQDLSRVGAATGRWLSSMRAARRNLRRHPGRYLIVRYEDIVDDPEATMQRVCRFAGLDYTAAMLSMTGAPDHRDAGGNSSFGDVEVQSISAKAIGRYRSVLSRGEIAFIQCVARRDMAATHYDPAEVGFTPTERARFALWELPSQFARMLGATSFEWMQRTRGARVSEPKHRDAS